MKPEMPKSFLLVILALVAVTIPLFFGVLFLGNARRKKRVRAVVLGELDALVTRLRQRDEVVLETLRSAPGGAGEPLLQATQAELDLLRRFNPSPQNLAELARLNTAMEQLFHPWFHALPDSYAKRKLVPIEEEAARARERYNDAVRVCGHGMFPTLPAAAS